MDVIIQAHRDYIKDWCSLWIGGVASNQPIRMNGQTQDDEIGHTRFQDAVAAWKSLQAQ